MVETGTFAVITELDVPDDRDNLVVKAFERLHPADGFEFRISSDIPLNGGLGSSAAAVVAGLMAADHLFELDADVFELAAELEGHPDNVGAALKGGFVVCNGARGPPVRGPARARGGAGRPRRGTADRGGARRAAGDRADRVRGVQHLPRRDADAGARHGRLGSDLRRACATGFISPTAPIFIRGPRTCSSARAASGALGATISGAGPTVLVWSRYDQTGAGRRGPEARDRRLGDRDARRLRASGRRRAARSERLSRSRSHSAWRSWSSRPRRVKSRIRRRSSSL